jgi:phage recombination protein Bet
MNVLATRSSTAIGNIAWWQDRNMISLVRKTAFKDCNEIEFDEAVAVARELNLSPLRRQIYAFVFNKTDEKKRSMVLVVSIDGARSIAARHQNYRPDNKPPRYVISEHAKNPLTNPEGLVSAEVSSFMFSHGDWHEVVAIAYWDEFAPIWREYTDSSTGETKPARLDPKKDGWRKMPRLMLAKCAEMLGLRKGWPEDLSRLYIEEETHKAQTLEGVDYVDLTPTEAADAAEAGKRLDRLGGPAILAANDDGSLERIEIGKFADWMLAQTQNKPADYVAGFVERNRAAINEFWAHSKNDALELKKVLEKRSAGGVSPSVARTDPASAASPPSSTSIAPDDTAAEAGPRTKEEFIASMAKCESKLGFLQWAQANREAMDKLTKADRAEVTIAFTAAQAKAPA